MATLQIVIHEWNPPASGPGHVNVEWRRDGVTVGWYGSNLDPTGIPLPGGVFDEAQASRDRIANYPNNHKEHVITIASEGDWNLSKQYATDLELKTKLGNGNYIGQNCVDFADNVLEIAFNDRNARISQYLTLQSKAQRYGVIIDQIQAWWDFLQYGGPPPGVADRNMFNYFQTVLNEARYSEADHGVRLAHVIDSYSPLALDLNGDGIRTISVEDSSAVFDITGDGVTERTGWLSPADGFLVHDRNFNGSVDGVAEMFGGKVGEGVAEIKALDTNSDGILNSADATFASLQVWRDADANGETGSGELLSLQSVGIQSIDLDFDATRYEFQNGNFLYERSTASLADGGRMNIVDVYFQISQQGDELSGQPRNPEQMPVGSRESNGELNGAQVRFSSLLPALPRERARSRLPDGAGLRDQPARTRVETAAGSRRPDHVYVNVTSLEEDNAPEEWSYTGTQRTASSVGRAGDLNRKRLQMIEAIVTFDLDAGTALDLMPRRTIDARTHELLTATSHRPAFS